jgi:hypothetical protein
MLKVKDLMVLLARLPDDAECAVVDNEGFNWLGGVLINHTENSVCFVARDVTLELGPDEFDEQAVEFHGIFKLNPDPDNEDDVTELSGADLLSQAAEAQEVKAKDSGEECVC